MAGNTYNKIKSISGALADHFNMVMTVSIIVSGFMIYFASAEVVNIVKGISSISEEKIGNIVSVEKAPITKAEYDSAAKFIQGHVPQVDVTVGADKMVISTKDGNNYQDWIFALAMMQSYSEKTVWDAKTICLQECGGAIATATLVGYRQNIAINID